MKSTKKNAFIFALVNVFLKLNKEQTPQIQHNKHTTQLPTTFLRPL